MVDWIAYNLPKCVYILCALFLLFPCLRFPSYFLSFLDFVGYLLQTLTRPYSSTWVTKGFKGLVAHAKYNPDSYESELFSLVFIFVLLEDEQKVGLGVFAAPILTSI